MNPPNAQSRTHPTHQQPRPWTGTGVVPEPDLDSAAAGARILLEALGLDLGDESLTRTPERMAASFAELMSPRPFQLTTFPNDGGYDELILARSIPLRSLCEHHMLSFVGVAHIGYLPGERILGLSKLARVLEHFACRPQVQERLTTQVANWLRAQLPGRRWSGHRGRTPLHDPPRRPSPRHDDHHLEPSRRPA